MVKTIPQKKESQTGLAWRGGGVNNDRIVMFWVNYTYTHPRPQNQEL